MNQKHLLKQNPKVSIIVPIYNVEAFLYRCMDSLISQTFKNIEIIALNDGSKDNSINILREYERRDSRIVVIDKQNEGLSQTRNIGIELATGDYITFVDGDDWLDVEMINMMQETAVKNNSDVVLCSYIREYKERSLPKVFDETEVIVYKKEDVKSSLYRKMVGPIGLEMKKPENLHSLITAWGKLYRSSIIKENNIKFIDTSVIGTEDCLFNVHAFRYVNQAVLINLPLYHYWKGNSSSLTSSYKPNLIKQWGLMYKYIREYLDEGDVGEEYYQALFNRICLSTLNLGLNECSKSNKVAEIKKIQNIKEMLNEGYIKDAFKKFDHKYLPIYWRVFYFANKHRMAITSYLILRAIEALRKVI